MGEARDRLPDFPPMVRRRSGVVALGLGLPMLLGGLAACGNDSPSSGGAADAAVERGQGLSRTRGCSACHGADGQGGLGPAWVDVMGTEVTLTDGSAVTVDEAYISQSITDPDAAVVAGYAVAMPKTDLSDAEVGDLVAYIVSLSG